MTRAFLLPAVIAVYMPFCTPQIRPTVPADVAGREMAELWRDPGDVSKADFVFGPWGKEHSPDPEVTYTFKHRKKNGVSPGMTVEDPSGREWSVKQGPEGQVEVVASRMLSALGYHQPPVYFMATLNVADTGETRVRAGGRLRLKEKGLKDEGEWSWQQNPFVGTRPYEGLLVLLDLLNSTDLKNSNNSLYKLKTAREDAKHWYVVRDLGSGLGETGRMNPTRNDPTLFEQDRFIDAVSGGFVQFTYDGFHQELFRGRISAANVRWACDLASRITDEQWHEVFQSTAYDAATTERFIAALKKRIAQGREVPD